MRKEFIVFFLTFFTFISSPLVQNNNCVVKAFNDSEIQYVSANINGWVKFQGQFDEEEAVKNIQDTICDFLGANLTNSETTTNESDKKIIYKGYYDGGSIKLIIENIYNTELKKYEGAIIIDITQYGSIWNITSIGDRVTKCLSTFGSGPPANICIEGYIDGKLESKEANETINDILAGMEAIKIESINCDNLISICGYTNNIKYFIKSNNRRININIACRYSPSDDKTYFWVGTPIINVEY